MKKLFLIICVFAFIWSGKVFSKDLAAVREILSENYKIKDVRNGLDDFYGISKGGCSGFRLPKKNIKKYFSQAIIFDDAEYYGSLCFVSGKIVLDDGRVFPWKIHSSGHGLIDLGEDRGGKWVLYCPDCGEPFKIKN